MLKKLVGGLAALLLFTLPSVAFAQTSVVGQLTYKYNSAANITTATTTTLKSGQGLVYGFCVNTIGTTSTLVLWDSPTASGTKLGTWTTGAVGCYTLEIGLKNGLTVVTTGSPAADITVMYR